MDIERNVYPDPRRSTGALNYAEKSRLELSYARNVIKRIILDFFENLNLRKSGIFTSEN